MKSVLVISERDTVATALVALEPGTVLEINDTTVTVGEPIPAGHKVAITSMRVDDPVVKYGSAIGIATADIHPGAHVHTHNVASTRGRGDLASDPGSPTASGRVPAEPDDSGARTTGDECD